MDMEKIRQLFQKVRYAVLFLIVGTLFVGTSGNQVALALTTVNGTTSSSSAIPVYHSQIGIGLGLALPQGMTVDKDNNLYVADTNNERVVKISPTGQIVGIIGGHGSGNGQFMRPIDVAIDSSDVIYVLDLQTGTVQAFTTSGVFVSSWLVVNYQTMQDGNITVGSNNNIYISGNNTIQEYTPSGTPVTQWGNTAGPGSIHEPIDIAADKNGHIYELDANSNDGTYKIQQFTLSGDFVRSWQYNNVANYGMPSYIAVDEQGYIYVTEKNSGLVNRFNPSGDLVGTWGGGGVLSQPRGVVADSVGNIYVSDTSNNMIKKFTFAQNIGVVQANSSSTTLSLPEGTNINTINSLTDTLKDGTYTYPTGLVSFTFQTTTGATVPIQMTVVTDLVPNQVTARKYNQTTKAYTAIAGSTITETTVSGHHALQLKYNVTDGGVLDEDGAANGTIVDPVGLAVNSETVTAPNTGFHQASRNYSVVGILTVTIGLAVAIATQAKRIKNRP